MTLSYDLAHLVATEVQRRGKQYFSRGAVQILQGDNWAVKARVQGTHRYQVRLSRRRSTLRIWCSCPYFHGHLATCKHVWATMLAADARGLLRGPGDDILIRIVEDEELIARYGRNTAPGSKAPPTEHERGDNGRDRPNGRETAPPRSADPRNGHAVPNGRPPARGPEPRNGHAQPRGPEPRNKRDQPRGPDPRNGRDQVNRPAPQRPPVGRAGIPQRPPPRDLAPPRPNGLPPDPRLNGTAKKSRKRKKQRPANWKAQLGTVRGNLQTENATPDPWPAHREILYIIDIQASIAARGVVVEVAQRTRKRDGAWAKPRPQRVEPTQVTAPAHPADRRTFALLAGAQEQVASPWSGYAFAAYYTSGPARYLLTEPLQEELVPFMCQTGRCMARITPEDPDLRQVRWDDGKPWEFWLQVALDKGGKQYLVTGDLRRNGDRSALAAPLMLIPGGLVFWEDRAARLTDFGAFDWITLLRSSGSMPVPVKEKDDLLQDLLRLPRVPRLDLPPELYFTEIAVPPRPRLKITPAETKDDGPRRLWAELSFDYDGAIVLPGQVGRGAYQAHRRRLMLRDPAVETAAAEKVRELGFKTGPVAGSPEILELAPRNLARAVRALATEGWYVEAEGKIYRQAGAFQPEVRSGIDWFELRARVPYGNTSANLPELLGALQRGEDLIRLDDGTYGLVPEEWLQKYSLLAGIGTTDGDHLRFAKSQVGFLDAVLSAQPETTVDATFARARDELHRFDGIEPVVPPVGFTGQLRHYQGEGLGWFAFLDRFGFGGCLADDMGLGKTVQVLALLESRRELRATQPPEERIGPSLVVVPRSLIFNWVEEAMRFTPKLRVLDHTGPGREKSADHFANYDVVLTTYGTLRRDLPFIRDVPFDYCILDEAQAIKNAETEASRAVRQLQGRHRLALSGTPVENHLGELWSLFDFLNPGMLGGASAFKVDGSLRNPGEATRKLLARSLRPFILRRTKEQVAKDLPQKLEQTVFCEMDGEQRRLYDELRDHYRRALLPRVERDGLGKSKMLVLEALLRLRQAACHPALLDKSKKDEPSAKLDVLMPQLAEVREEGHKALVFSQFTSLLALVRDRLDAEGVTYQYLDGRTRDRQARVELFQNDPECKLFLISLKAGGLGLNLTSADYVFLLDPWWNPAVEAQAIDRAHRIGQTRPVFAYRLIARDTVEEKVLALQQTKRELADAIINADNSLVKNLSREDLELLLS
jgi:superfamily II DNA or RNA helicase